jgi:S1-C subfamily serine protease
MNPPQFVPVLANRTPAKSRVTAYAALGLFALAGALVGASATGGAKSSIELKRDATPVARGQLEAASFSNVVKRVSPAVVKITTETKSKRVAAAASAGLRQSRLPPILRRPHARHADAAPERSRLRRHRQHRRLRRHQ